MSEAGLEPVRLSWSGEWFDVWRRDDPHNYVYDVYFDRESHGLVWIDNPNTTLTPIDNDPFESKSELVASDPNRYERIAPLTHSEHGEIFRAWVDSWPEDVRNRCGAGSLQSFIDCLRRILPERAEGARTQWSAYHEARLKELAAGWLGRCGFAVEWED